MTKPGRPRKRLLFDELPEVMDVPDVAKFLDVAPSTLYERIHAGQFPALKLGRRIKISRWQLGAALGLPTNREAVP